MALDQAAIETLKGVSTATLTTVLLKKGLRNVWMRGTKPLRPGQPRSVGPAFTFRFVPAREDLATPASWGSPISTRAAIEEGIVPGGGSALVHAVSVLDDNLGLEGDEALGVRIVRKSADEPLRWIAENGGENGYVITTKVRELGVGNGYNAATGEYGDLVAQGVLDPVKVTRSALVNATSIAAMRLTTETLIVEKPEDEEAAPAGGHGHGHGH